jgi:orotidine-5'-phosphate decarboxylase
MAEKSPIILAVDTVDLNRVKELVGQTREHISIYKFGLEFYLRHGLNEMLLIKKKLGIEIFLDLKLHDIPNTVRKSAEAIAEIEPFFLTVHAAGGGEMVRAASEVLPRTHVAAVTILTSLDQDSLGSLGLNVDIEALTLTYADVALAAGARALVASPHEVAALKERFPSTILITPGIRTETDTRGDQRRIMTPQAAMSAGSNYLVIGRPITESHSPKDAAKRIYESL